MNSVEANNMDGGDLDDQVQDYNKLVEDLGEEASRIDQLRKQHLEKEEKQAKNRKRLHQQAMDKKQKEKEEKE